MAKPRHAVRACEGADQQAALALLRTRDLLVKQRRQLLNMIRSLLAEFGIDMARELHHALPLARKNRGFSGKQHLGGEDDNRPDDRGVI